MAKKKIYAQKTFIDGKRERVIKGDLIEEDRYDVLTLKHYERYGMIADKKPAGATTKAKNSSKETKPAAQKESTDADEGSTDDTDSGSSADGNGITE